MNMNPQQIMDGMAEKNRLLTSKNTEYAGLSEKRARAEETHSIALAKKMIELKLAGQSVTLIPALAKGDKAVATLKYDLDVSDGVLRACNGSMNDLRASIDTYRSILSFMKLEYKNVGS